MPVKPIQHSRVTSFEQLDREHVARQAGVRTVANEDIGKLIPIQPPSGAITIDQRMPKNPKEDVG
jgi:hypothetical protein